MKKLNLWIVLIIGMVLNMLLLNYSFEALSAPDSFLVFLGVLGLALFANVVYWLYRLAKKIVRLNK